jgi:hypothetical protein
MDPHAIEVGAALAGVRRRARLLEESKAGMVLFVSAVGGWQHDRLRRRVDAMSKLLIEIGYPGGA